MGGNTGGVCPALVCVVWVWGWGCTCQQQLLAVAAMGVYMQAPYWWLMAGFRAYVLFLTRTLTRTCRVLAVR